MTFMNASAALLIAAVLK